MKTLGSWNIQDNCPAKGSINLRNAVSHDETCYTQAIIPACGVVVHHHHRQSQFLQSTAWSHWISGQVLCSQSIVSSSTTVRPCSPWRGRWIGHWRTTWSTICSSAQHSQAAERAITHLCKQKRKRLTPMRRRLSRTHAVLGRTIPGGWVPVLGIKVRSLVVLSKHPAFHLWSAQSAASCC